MRLWLEPRGRRESTPVFFIPEQQEQALVPAHRASLLLSVDSPVTAAFAQTAAFAFFFSSRTISTGNLNLLTGQKIKCERWHPVHFCKKRLALLKRRRRRKKKKPYPTWLPRQANCRGSCSVPCLLPGRTPDMIFARPLLWDYSAVRRA